MPIPMTHPSALDLLYLCYVCSFTALRTTPHYNKQKCRLVQNNQSQLCVNSHFAVIDSVRGNGILQKQCCCMRETGGRAEKASYQSVRATVIPESRREASITYIRYFSKPEWTSNIVEAGLNHRRCHSYPVTRAHTRDS